MITLNQINEIHERLGKQTSLPEFLLALRAIGVEKYDSFITDGHSEYFGKDNQKVVSLPAHEKLIIAKTSNQDEFLKHLNLHEQGKTSYHEMSQGLANSGIEKWTSDTIKMTITYCDSENNEMLVETIN
jgi:uncharacterized protein YbcV (DUF1398 family)